MPTEPLKPRLVNVTRKGPNPFERRNCHAMVSPIRWWNQPTTSDLVRVGKQIVALVQNQQVHQFLIPFHARD